MNTRCSRPPLRRFGTSLARGRLRLEDLYRLLHGRLERRVVSLIAGASAVRCGARRVGTPARGEKTSQAGDRQNRRGDLAYLSTSIIEPPSAKGRATSVAARPPARLGYMLVTIGADDLAAIAGAEGPPGQPRDAVLDEPDAAVGHQDVRPARVVARHGVAERAVDAAAGQPNRQPPPGKTESRLGVWMMLVYVQPPLPSDQLNPRIVEYDARRLVGPGGRARLEPREHRGRVGRGV